METIGVSEEVKATLTKMKEYDGHTSYDSVVRELILYRKIGIEGVQEIRDMARADGQDWESIVERTAPRYSVGVEEEHEIETEPELERNDE